MLPITKKSENHKKVQMYITHVGNDLQKILLKIKTTIKLEIITIILENTEVQHIEYVS